MLFESDHAKVYLADPKTGRLAFEREGYLNQFNYRVPKGEKVSLAFEGDNKSTVLYVNGHHRETLGAVTLYVVKPSDKANYQVEDSNAFKPTVYQPKDQMYYQRTLVFPLAKAGQFNGTLTNLKVLNYKEH